MKKVKLLSLFLLLTSLSFSQKKILQTQFTKEKISIDGKLNESAWANAQVAKDFVMLAPDNGKSETNERRSEVKILYDNTAIYIAAKLYDNEPKKISKELTTRDDFAMADHFGVFLNGYNDGQQEFRFFVSASGVQQDMIYTDNAGEDSSWNAIWDSHVEITDEGWNVEMKIPYAALRFSSEKKQTWGLNFYREINRDRQQFSWSRIDNKINSEANQAGILEGIENIDTPTRLFFIPYSSFYLNSNKEQTKGQLKGGMDIKYGINDAFTLDAILIPDFGQTAFDNVVLNLGPFEQQFQENRPFFTEGTDLFNKGGIFYSRRIGGNPSTSATLSNDEEYIKNPSTVKLLNALKISGRTKKGLGIGFLNAITENTYAEIINTTNRETRKELLEPLANYNIFVLDQRFRKNSSVSFTNTNVTRNGSFRDANVSALTFDLNTKKNTYKLSGDYKYSIINEANNLPYNQGYKTSLSFDKTSGKYRTGISGEYYSENWNPNDLGINYQTHYHSFAGYAGYKILKPTKKYNSFSAFLNLYSEFDNRTDRIQASTIQFTVNSVSKKNNYFGYGITIRPLKNYDFYEPRSDLEKKFFTQPEYFNGYFSISTNYNKKFAIDVNPSFAFFNEKDRFNYGGIVSPRYRFNNKLSVVYSFQFNFQNNNKGWVAFDGSGNTIFACRDRYTYTNTLQGKYSINNVMNFNLSVRHYWSYALNNQYLTLQDDGSLIENNLYTTNKNSNFGTWNLDLTYSWWFAPGSQITILYRNYSSIYNRVFSTDFASNYKDLVNHEILTNVLSVSVRYFIDYNSAKHWFSKG